METRAAGRGRLDRAQMTSERHENDAPAVAPAFTGTDRYEVRRRLGAEMATGTETERGGSVIGGYSRFMSVGGAAAGFKVGHQIEHLVLVVCVEQPSRHH